MMRHIDGSLYIFRCDASRRERLHREKSHADIFGNYGRAGESYSTQPESPVPIGIGAVLGGYSKATQATQNGPKRANFVTNRTKTGVGMQIWAVSDKVHKALQLAEKMSGREHIPMKIAVASGCTSKFLIIECDGDEEWLRP